MAKGFDGVRQAAADIEARKNSGGGGGSVLWFKLPNAQDQGQVRFLEEGTEVAWAWVHEVPPSGKQKWNDEVPCRNQEDDGTPCPMCESADQDIKARRFKGWINVIWRNAPIFKRDAEGALVKENGQVTVVGTKDQVALWEQGITVFRELDGKDSTYKGLTNRDFVITRLATGMDTKYAIEPVVIDGESKPSPMSEADAELAKTKYDLNEYVTPSAYEELAKRLGGGQNGGAGPFSSTAGSPFGRGAEESGVSGFMEPTK